jgi:hypothetical protein
MKRFLIVFLLIGCSPEKEIQRVIDTVIRYDTVKVTLPQDVVFDTVYINREGEGENVRYVVKVDTVKVLIKGKERIVKVPVTDTVIVTQVIEKVKEESTFEKFETMIYTVLGVSVVVGLIRMFWR